MNQDPQRKVVKMKNLRKLKNWFRNTKILKNNKLKEAAIS